MRNFSSVVSQSCTFVLDGRTRLGDPAFVRVTDALMITMGANPRSMNTSEEGVLNDFANWVVTNSVACRDGERVPNPVFAYHNLNEGHSLAVIWVKYSLYGAVLLETMETVKETHSAFSRRPTLHLKK